MRDLGTPPLVTAVILAGGADDALARAAGKASKALVSFSGRPLVSYVVDALRQTPGIGYVYAVGPLDRALGSQVDRSLSAGDSFIESFSAGVYGALEHAPHQHILVITADLPWLEAAALEDFLARAGDAHLAYPVVRRETARAQFPTQKRTYVRLREGHFTGGNLMLLSPAIVPALLPFVRRAYEGRKNPLALARLFGVDFIWRLALGQLSLPQIESRATRILGLPVRAVETPHACIGADVDRLEHLG